MYGISRFGEKLKKRFEEKLIQMTSLRRFAKFAAKKMKISGFEAKTIKDGVWLTEKLEDSQDSCMM